MSMAQPPVSERSGLSKLGVIALILAPLLVVTGVAIYLKKLAASEGILQAAILNNDQPATVDGKTMALGDQLSQGIMDRKGTGINWTMTDAAGSDEGLKSGKYTAVLVIPAEFSTAATSVAKNKASQAIPAKLEVRTSPHNPVADTLIMHQVAAMASDSIGAMITKGYMDNVYVAFNTMGKQFAAITNGAMQLKNGAEQLSDGINTAQTGSTKLAGGLQQLNSASGQLQSGSSQLAAGGTRVSDGAAALSAGSSQLAAGTATLNSKMPALTSGASSLASGAGDLTTGIKQYTYATSLVVNGIKQLAGGLNTLRLQLAKSSFNTTQLTQLRNGAQTVAAGAANLNTGLNNYAATLQAMSTNPNNIPPEVSAGYLQQCQANGGTAAECQATLPIFLQGFMAGTGAAYQGLNTPGPSGQTLLQGAAALSAGAAQVSAGVNTLVQQLTTLMPQLISAVNQLSSGANQLYSKSTALIPAGSQLVAGSTAVSSGAWQLRSGAWQLRNGVGQLADGSARTADGASQLAAGVNRFAAGIFQLTAGLNRYTDGVQQAASGSNQLASGMNKLSTGGTKLSDGANKFAYQLKDGADELPSFTAADRETLSSVVAQPVNISEQELTSLPITSPIALLIVLALWFGALASFLLLRRRMRAANTTGRAWARAMVPALGIAAVQVVALAIIGNLILNLTSETTIGLAALLAFIATLFVAANHALAAWGHSVGRIISITLLTLALSMGLSTAASGILADINNFLPLAQAADSVRSLLVNGSPTKIGTLAIWLVVAMVASLVAAAAFHGRRNPAVATEPDTAQGDIPAQRADSDADYPAPQRTMDN